MNYYNDNDPFCCAWLRELIKAGLIPEGEVDERSILDVRPGDLAGFRQCHFFAGIAGWAYALQLAGWPEDREVWTGSCPCQPLSCAGQRKGHADERHLWPGFYRLIAECRPSTVLGEQVSSKDGREWLAGVRADLEGVGYAVGGAGMCAASVGAPHRRQRLFWVANAQSRRFEQHHSGERRIFKPGANGTNGRLADSEYSDRRPPTQGRDDRDGNDRGRNEAASGSAMGGEADRGLEHVRPQLYAELRGKGFGEGCFWSDAIWIPTCDPRTGETKMRRISSKPSLFPLVARLPGRVGMLRGAGNAICPEVAAEFIKAFLETEK